MKSKQSNWLKHLLQWGTLAAIVGFIIYGSNFGSKPVDVEAYCPYGGLQALGSYLVRNSLTCAMSMVQITIGVTLAFAVILFSKLFCGYLCPLGTVTEWLGRGGRKLKMNYDITPGSIADRTLRVIKYGLLFMIVYMSVTSSELFCKNFDPYYAVATGFKGELTPWMAAISIGVMILGSFFVKMFWCKYICPLGALSNIFKFTLTFIGIIALMWVMNLVGIANAWVYALAIACIVGYVWEMLYLRSKVFPLMTITRDDTSCNKCGLCVRQCPYSIDIKNMSSVKHVDCTLCGECISSCSEGSLQINRQKALRWVPGVIAVVLFFCAVWVGNIWEVPTIDEKWGEIEKVENLQTIEIAGLTSVKCFGSSKAFSAKMQKVPGVYGVSAFVKRFAVVISYDPTVTNEEEINKAIFTPTVMKFRTPKPDIETLKIVHLGVEGLHDKMDMVYIGAILRNIEGVYGFDAEYNCPVDVRLYVDPSVNIEERMIRDSLEVKEVKMLAHGGAIRTAKVHYVLKSFTPDYGTIARMEFLNNMFASTREGLSGAFKSNAEKYADEVKYPKAIYEMVYAGIEKPLIKRNFPYFRGFLSLKEGVTGVDVELNDQGYPVIRITYVKSMWDDAKIWKEWFNATVWPVKYKDGTLKDEEPKIAFTKEGRTI